MNLTRSCSAVKSGAIMISRFRDAISHRFFDSHGPVRDHKRLRTSRVMSAVVSWCAMGKAGYPQSIYPAIGVRVNTPKVWFLSTRFNPSCSQGSFLFMNGCYARKSKTFHDVRAYVC